jgi:TonB-dependent starch-binding outer membrane protein SusC
MNFTKLAKPMLMGLLACLCSFLVQAQTKTITGKVTDRKDGSPLSAVSVTVKGAKTGTQTDATGAFRINVPASARTLVISSVGYANQEVSIENKTSIQVSLGSVSEQLSDVVVIG